MEQVKKTRIEVVDSLRGFAIMGIMLLHSIEHFNFYYFPKKETQPDWLNNLDQHVWDSLFFMFGGKGYAIFALLFGFTFSLMYAKQRAKGIDFGPRFLWRMLLLACFGLFNGLFFPGEILLMYSVVGIILFLVRKWSSNALLILAVFLLLQPIELFHYFHFLIDNTAIVASENLSKYWNLLREGQLSDSFFSLIKSNAKIGQKVSFYWSFKVGRLVQSAGLFVLGYWLGKKNVFEENSSNTKFWKRILVWSSVFFVCFYSIEKNFKSFENWKVYKENLLIAIDMYGNLAFALFLVSSYILLYQTNFFRKLVGGLKYCGRMSLTVYVLQSVIGSFVFYEYGLGIGPSMRHTMSLGVGILLFSVQLYFCKFWIQKYKQGPLEKLWHYLTWLPRKK